MNTEELDEIIKIALESKSNAAFFRGWLRHEKIQDICQRQSKRT